VSAYIKTTDGDDNDEFPVEELSVPTAEAILKIDGNDIKLDRGDVVITSE